jgi:hypothetical protein
VSNFPHVTDPNLRIQAALERLARRERWIAGARMLAVAVGAAAGLFAALGWALAHGWVSPASLTGWLSMAGAAWVLAVLDAGRDLGRPLDLRAQARRVEAFAEDLRGTLLAVVDRAERPLGSPVLVARLAERVSSRLEGIAPDAVHPARALRVASAASLLAVLAWIAALDGGALGPRALLALLDRPAAAVGETVVPDGPRAVVGDLELRYLYPTYTRLEPITIPNSNGEIHAPPGTRVEIAARTARVWTRASVVVYDAPPAPAELVDGRSVRSALVVAGEGAWRLEFDGVPSPTYRIVPEPDLAPDVSIVGATKSLAVAEDAPLPLRYAARDDYGLRALQVEIREGGKVRVVPLRTLLDLPREAGGDVGSTARELGIAAGTVVRLRVGAADNDEVSGSKIGWSSAVEVEVLGPRGRATRRMRLRQEIRDALVDVLAAFVLEAAPAVGPGARGDIWAERADARYDAVDAMIAGDASLLDRESFDGRVLRRLGEHRRVMLATARTLGERAGERDVAELGKLQAQHLDTLEDAILALDEILRMASLEAVAELVQRLTDEATALRSRVGSLTAAESLARLDQLGRLFRQLDSRAASLDEGALKEFLADRGAQARALMEAVRQALAAGRTAEAEELMRRLADAMEAMKRDLQEMQSRGGESRDKTSKAMQELATELKDLAESQARLHSRTEAARERFGGGMDQAVAAWEQVETLALELVDAALRSEGARGAFRDGSYANRSALEDVRTEAEGLHDSTRARDLGTARTRARRVADALGWLSRRARLAGGDAGLAADLRGMEGRTSRIQELLESMARARTRSSPELQRALQEMAAEQQQLAQRAAKATESASRVAKKLPMDAPGLEEGTRRAAEQGGQAAEALRTGEALRAGGAQRATGEGLQEAIAALQQAQQDMKDMQQAAQGEGEGKPGEGKGDRKGRPDGKGDEDSDAQDVALPAPEAFQTPEAYRKALLEGMQGEVPEEYKALNRRYYEELVRQ